MRISVLFICVKNSARSQMAEAFLNAYCPDDFAAESAGLEPGELNPLAVQVMAEVGIDISRKIPRRVFEVVQTGKVFGHTISLCDEANEGRCPMVPRSTQKHHWGFMNPAINAEEADALIRMRNVRDMISEKVRQWCDEKCAVQA